LRSSIRFPALRAQGARLSPRASVPVNSLRTSSVKRFYSDTPKPEVPPKNPGQPLGNAPFYLSAAGFVGIAYYVYLINSDKLEKKPAASGTVKATVSALDKDKFVEFPIKKIEPYNHNTTKFTFELPEGTGTLLPVAGCLVVKAATEDGPKDKKGNPIIRPYTPISPADKAGELELIVKKYDTGKFTPYLFGLKVGDKVAFKGPIPKLPYKANEYDQVAMIAGGSGITPMYQVLEHALEQKDDKTKFTLIFANVTPADILLREEFEKLKQAHPDRFDPIFLIDKPTDGWSGYTGYITPEIIKEHVKGPSDQVKILVCGPPGQVNALAGAKDGMKQGSLAGTLKELGYTEDQVFKF